MNKQKGLSPILIVLLIAVAAIGGYLVYTNYKSPVFDRTNNRNKTAQSTPVSTSSPIPISPDETASWKTYTNDKYQFTFNYPNSWIIGEGDGKQSRGVPFIFLRPKSLQTQDKTYGEVTIWIYSNIKTIEEYAAKLCDSPGVCVSSNNIKEIKVAGLDAFNIKNIPGPIPSEEVIFKKGNLLIAFHFNYQGENYNDYSNKGSKQVFDKILSTFKFTN